VNRLVVAPGLIHYPGFLDRAAQEALRDEVEAVLAQAPPYRPTMPRTGKPLSVEMTNCGQLGWVSDVGGYRYQAEHPRTGERWPAIPASLAKMWQDIAENAPPPEACLVNLYGPGARMGLHQDRDELALDVPVVSLSLGWTAIFRIGGATRSAATRSIRLASGDAFVIGGEGRLAFHGVDRLVPDSSTLLARPGRINLTLRRVTPV
jgi:alkylated DNA repair protein (DNA oxidative demethylase)